MGFHPAVSEEKIQKHSRLRGPIFLQPFTLPENVQCAIPPPPQLLYCTKYQCDTLLCNITGTLSQGKQERKLFAIPSLKASRDVKSIIAGPLSTAENGEKIWTLGRVEEEEEVEMCLSGLIPRLSMS